MSAYTVVLTNESQPRFDALLAAYTEKFQPRGEVEADLVEEMAVAKWRQRRLWSIETAALDLEMDRQEKAVEKELLTTGQPTRTAIAFTALENKSRSISLFLRYQSRMRRGYRRALAGFHAICDTGSSDEIENVPNEPSPISEQ